MNEPSHTELQADFGVSPIQKVLCLQFLTVDVSVSCDDLGPAWPSAKPQASHLLLIQMESVCKSQVFMMLHWGVTLPTDEIVVKVPTQLQCHGSISLKESAINFTHLLIMRPDLTIPSIAVKCRSHFKWTPNIFSFLL